MHGRDVFSIVATIAQHFQRSLKAETMAQREEKIHETQRSDGTKMLRLLSYRDELYTNFVYTRVLLLIVIFIVTAVLYHRESKIPELQAAFTAIVFGLKQFTDEVNVPDVFNVAALHAIVPQAQQPIVQPAQQPIAPVAGLQADNQRLRRERNDLRNREKAYWILIATFYVWIVILIFYFIANCSPKVPSSKNPTADL
ncbi:hypothetical protein DdX_16098 [Ditylenchus destructor]|uniref:Uncharacterized protein n=1 Tax=Ditylenchus destructor TaxID=166010 RepID=A0AAD4MTN9_9BILA|nr:hypothetical protein DdX_16098 [Ditylenchus destructor]